MATRVRTARCLPDQRMCQLGTVMVCVSQQEGSGDVIGCDECVCTDSRSTVYTAPELNVSPWGCVRADNVTSGSDKCAFRLYLKSTLQTQQFSPKVRQAALFI